MLLETERDLYRRCWGSGYTKSQCAVPMISFIAGKVNQGDKVLEIGSGDGTTMFGLRAKGLNVTGSDIYSTRSEIVECSAWDLPFKDGEFNVTFSTDVLEHLPTEMVDKAISEILRVTSRQSIHIIATFLDIRLGEVVHKTVNPIEWWVKKFDSLNTNKQLLILDREKFL